MGHLLTSGLLADDAEIAAVAERLVSPGMSAGFGLRTMSSASGGYGPLRYHCGTVWPHDTAIAVAGLVRSGHGALVHDLVDGMLAASTAFDGRLPELWSGDARADVAVPLPYPAACRPQAWAAASAVSLVASLLGLDPDVPNGTLAVRPVPGSPVGALSAHGLVVAGMPLDVDVDVHAQAANAARTRVGSAAGLRLLS
jgi:glycogen debranching enzyme